MCECLVCVPGICDLVCFFFQAEDGIRDLVRSRGLGDVYKRQIQRRDDRVGGYVTDLQGNLRARIRTGFEGGRPYICLLYTSDAADERSSVDLGGRRIIKKKNKTNTNRPPINYRDKHKTHNTRKQQQKEHTLDRK